MRRQALASDLCLTTGWVYNSTANQYGTRLDKLAKNHKHKRAFNQGVLAKPVFDQPYWVHHQAAIWLFRLHRRCVLCQLHHLDYQMGRMNFICADCQANIATQVSYFNIHLNIGKDFPTNKDRLTAQQTPKRQHIRAYPVSYYQYPVNQLIKNLKTMKIHNHC